MFIDTDQLQSIRDMDDALLVELVDVWRTQSLSILAQIARPEYSDKAAENERLLHKLCGGSRQLGAVELGNLARELEDAVIAGRPVMPAQLEELRGLFERSAKAINLWMQAGA